MDIDAFIKENCNRSYLVDKLLPSGYIALLATEPGGGKSFFATALTLHVAYGIPFLGFNVEKRPVVVIDSDNPGDELSDRQRRFKMGLNGLDSTTSVELPKPENIKVLHYCDLRLDKMGSEGSKDVKRTIEEVSPGLITIDHLSAFHRCNENSSKDMERVAGGLDELRKISGATILAIHHFGKKEGDFCTRLRGSTALLARSEIAFEIVPFTTNGRLERIGLIPQQRKVIVPEPMMIQVVESENLLQLKHIGEYNSTINPKDSGIACKIYHLFQDKDAKLSVKDVYESLTGLASMRETRDILSEFAGKYLDLDRANHGKYLYKHSSKTPSKCPFCPGLTEDNEKTEKLKSYITDTIVKYNTEEIFDLPDFQFSSFSTYIHNN